MKLHYWTGFSKRDNSTKIPTATATQIDVVWKEDTSIDTPSVLLKGNVLNIDYCYIPDFGKYYNVGAPIILTNGLTQYDLEEDVLATHKTAIGNTVAYIAYSSTGYDADIVDTRLPVKTTKTFRKHEYTATIFDDDGCYILTVANTVGGVNGFCTSYVCTKATIQSCASYLMSLDIDDRLIKSIYNPFDAIISCLWLPLDVNTIQTTYCTGPVSVVFGDLVCDGHEITPGVYAPSIASYALTNPYYTNIGLFTTFTPVYTDFRKVQPYTTYSLFIPFYGLIDLNASDVQNVVDNLNVCYSIDIATGDMSVGINCLAIPGWCQTITCNIGVNCPIAQTSTNTTGTLASIGGTAGGVAGAIISGITGNVPGAIVGGMGALFSAANTALSYSQRGLSIRGGVNGRSMIPLGNDFVLMEFAQDTEDPDNANYIAKYGRPVGVTHAINNHSGYVQCENASIEIAGDLWERTQINTYLNGGFYYE
ncbi:MAG: hypothetical protein J6T10_20460 [Methanobrevibacter sp.]|nr:hypothetical protein [Methanobrevibacter sp.]